MANAPYEIPNELRDFAERSVDQARKAFEGFVTVAQKTAGTVDGAANDARSGVKHVGSQILGYAEQNDRDYAALADAVASGRLEAVTGL